MKLEIGIRQSPRKLGKEWEHLDVCPWPHVELVSAMNIIDRPDNYYDEIFSSHVLEHVTRPELSAVFTEWNRVLKPNALLEIIVPNMKRIIGKIFYCEQALSKTKDEVLRDEKLRIMEELMKWLYGGQKDSNDFHKIGFTQNYLQYYLSKHGFVEITVKELNTLMGKLNLLVRCKKAK